MKIMLAFASIMFLTFIFGGTAFADEGFIQTKSGLRYKDLKTGTGDIATPGKIVTIHIKGWLNDNGRKGSEFICSRDLNRPVSFKLGTRKVMQAWNIGVAGMKVGGKRRLMVPPEVGYGNRSIDGVIPPNSHLILEVELLDIKSAGR